MYTIKDCKRTRREYSIVTPTHSDTTVGLKAAPPAFTKPCRSAAAAASAAGGPWADARQETNRAWG